MEPSESHNEALDSELASLAAWAQGRLPRLIDSACATVNLQMPIYRSGQTVPEEDLRRSVERNLGSLITALGQPHASLDLAAPAETGHRRAHQGVPLPEVLRAYRISFAALWDALIERLRTETGMAAETLLAAATRIWELMDEHAVALTESYRAATAELLLTQQRRRSALVEALLTGHLSPEAGQWEAASLLGLPPDGQLVVVAADTRSLAEQSLPGIERLLAAQGIVSRWRLTPAQQLGIVSLQQDQHERTIELLRTVASARTGVSPLYRSLADTPRALQLAEAALAGLKPGRADVRVFSASPIAALLVSEPDEAQRLAEQVLGAVLGLQVEDRVKLLSTLNAYVDCAGLVERTADALDCHPNTVRYRLRRIQELTGRSLTDPRQIAELTAAADAFRLSSATVLWRGRRPRAIRGTRRPRPSDGP